MTNQENVVNKNLLINRVKKGIGEEKRLIGKIIQQIKLAKKNSGLPLNIEEKRLRVYLEGELKKWEARKIPKTINRFLMEIKASLQKKEKVLLHGYFGLKVNHSAARKVRNPQTGQPILIPAKNRLSFRTSSKLKREIN